MVEVCVTWKQPDLNHFNGFCTNRFRQTIPPNGVVIEGGCFVCVVPIEVPAGIGTVTRSCIPDDGRCIGDTGPTTFQIMVTSQTGTQDACFPQYQGTFLLYVTSDASSCFNYESTEIEIVTPGCAEAGTGVVRWFAAFANITGSVELSVVAKYNIGGISTTLIRYSAIIGSVGITNCVGSFTLDRNGSPPTGYPFAATMDIEAV